MFGVVFSEKKIFAETTTLLATIELVSLKPPGSRFELLIYVVLHNIKGTYNNWPAYSSSTFVFIDFSSTLQIGRQRARGLLTGVICFEGECPEI